MPNILGFLTGGAKYPRILGRGVPNILGFLAGGVPNILQSDGGSSFPEGVLDFLGNIAWGCQISGGAKFPVTPDTHFTALAFRPLAILPIYGKCTRIPYLRTLISDAVLLLVKAAGRERKLGPCPEIPYCPEIPSLTLPVR